MLNKFDSKYVLLATVAISAAVLVACGGSGSAASSGVSLSGTAATGAAIAGGSVDVKCSSGSASATTSSDGSYTISVSSGILPCMLRVTSADGLTVLHSVADGSGTGSATANITPLSELVVAKALGPNSTPADAFTAYSASTTNNLATAKLSDAKQVVLAALAGTVALPSGVDPLTTAFKVGDATDQQLDALKAKLTAAGTSLSDLSNAVVTSQTSGSTTAATTITNILSPLPSNLSTAGCSGLHNGTYVSVNQRGQIIEHTLDYNSLTVRSNDGSTGTIAINNDRACHFTITYASSSVVVDAVFGPSGVGSFRTIANGCITSTTTSCDSLIGVFFPKQTITSLADLAGTYNFAGYDRDTTTSIHHFGISTGSLAADGTYAGFKCTSASGTFNCSDANYKRSGAFTVANGLVTADDGSIGYPFRAADGTMMIVFGVLHDNGIRIATKQKALSLPALGYVNKFWDVYGTDNSISSFGSVGELSAQRTIAAIDTTQSSYTRDDGVTYYINKPVDGIRYRSAGTNSSGQNLSGQVLMKVGTFLSFYGNEYVANETRSTVGFSISQ